MRFGGNPIEGSNPSLSATLHACRYPPQLIASSQDRPSRGQIARRVLTKGGLKMRTLLTRGATLIAAFTLVVAAGASPVAASNRHYVALAVGYDFACALTDQGRAYCWGENNDGRLGDGSEVNRNVATPVAGNLKFSTIAAGEYHVCGITTRGDAYCWGEDAYGQLGDDQEQPFSSLPVAVVGGLKFQKIAAGGYHTCALTKGGAAYCWGYNSEGQLGNGDNVRSRMPVAVSGDQEFSSIGTGEFHTCALTKGGTAYCWGDNWYGQLGDNSNLDRSIPVPVAGGVRFMAISPQMNHTCALTRRGSAYCWGSNRNGQYGNGDTYASAIPLPAVGGKKYAWIASSASGGMGYAQCYGLRSGRWECMGNASDVEHLNNDSLIPVKMTLHQRVVSSGASYYNVCALTSAGKIYCAGGGDVGALGNGSWTNSLTPVAVR